MNTGVSPSTGMWQLDSITVYLIMPRDGKTMKCWLATNLMESILISGSITKLDILCMEIESYGHNCSSVKTPSYELLTKYLIKQLNRSLQVGVNNTHTHTHTYTHTHTHTHTYIYILYQIFEIYSKLFLNCQLDQSYSR